MSVITDLIPCGIYNAEEFQVELDALSEVDYNSIVGSFMVADVEISDSLIFHQYIMQCPTEGDPVEPNDYTPMPRNFEDALLKIASGKEDMAIKMFSKSKGLDCSTTKKEFKKIIIERTSDKPKQFSDWELDMLYDAMYSRFRVIMGCSSITPIQRNLIIGALVLGVGYLIKTGKLKF